MALQAMEVKEGLEPSPMNHSNASITYQKLFSLYPKMSGMTVGPRVQLICH